MGFAGACDPGAVGESDHLPGVCPDLQPVWKRNGGVCPPHWRQAECELYFTVCEEVTHFNESLSYVNTVVYWNVLMLLMLLILYYLPPPVLTGVRFSLAFFISLTHTHKKSLRFHVLTLNSRHFQITYDSQLYLRQTASFLFNLKFTMHHLRGGRFVKQNHSIVISLFLKVNHRMFCYGPPQHQFHAQSLSHIHTHTHTLSLSLSLPPLFPFQSLSVSVTIPPSLPSLCLSSSLSALSICKGQIGRASCRERV